MFNAETNELVSLGSLFAQRDSAHLATYCAVGYVLPSMENAVDEAEEMPGLEDCQFIRLSTIRCLSLFNFDDDGKALDKYTHQML